MLALVAQLVRRNLTSFVMLMTALSALIAGVIFLPEERTWLVTLLVSVLIILAWTGLGVLLGGGTSHAQPTRSISQQ